MFSNSSVDEVKLSGRIPPNKPIRDAHQILSSLQKPMALESNVADYMGNSTTELGSSIKKHQVPDTVLLDFPEDIQPPRASLQHHESSENVGIWESSENIDIGGSPELISCEAISSCNGSESSKEVDLYNSHQ